jgi:hypothetical protein
MMVDILTAVLERLESELLSIFVEVFVTVYVGVFVTIAINVGGFVSVIVNVHVGALGALSSCILVFPPIPFVPGTAGSCWLLSPECLFHCRLADQHRQTVEWQT